VDSGFALHNIVCAELRDNIAHLIYHTDTCNGSRSVIAWKSGYSCQLMCTCNSPWILWFYSKY